MIAANLQIMKYDDDDDDGEYLDDNDDYEEFIVHYKENNNMMRKSSMMMIMSPAYIKMTKMMITTIIRATHMTSFKRMQ